LFRLTYFPKIAVLEKCEAAAMKKIRGTERKKFVREARKA